MMACAIGNIQIIDLILMNKDVKADAVDKNGFNSLYYASYYGRTKVVNHIKMNHPAIKYERSHNGTTCLHVAVRRGHLKLAEFFLKKLQESEKDKQLKKLGGENPLKEWKRLRDWESAIDIDEQKNDGGMNALFIAIKEKNLDMLKLLRKYGADFSMSVTVGKGQ